MNQMEQMHRKEDVIVGRYKRILEKVKNEQVAAQLTVAAELSDLSTDVGRIVTNLGTLESLHRAIGADLTKKK